MPLLAPVYTAHLFRPLLDELLGLLRGLSAEHWDAPTVAGAWRVRDVAAHLLDGDLRKVAVFRDGHAIPTDGPIASAADLSRLVNGLNASGVAFAARLSPRLLVDLLELSGGWVADVLAALPPHGPARYGVSWAGESASENWMDTGREYTERWHHQMQIRDAVGAEPILLARRWLRPLLDLSVRALPVAYTGVDAPPGTRVHFQVIRTAPPRDGDDTAPDQAVGAWSLTREAAGWTLQEDSQEGASGPPAAAVRATDDAAWRLFYNALRDPARAAGVNVSGDAQLAAPLLGARSVVL